MGLIYTPSGFVSIQEKIDIVVAYLSNSNNSPDIKATDKLEDGTKIGVYVQDIRSDFKEGKLTDPQIEQLQGKGFIWRHPRKLKEKNIDDKIDIVANYLSNPDNDPHIKKDQILEDGTTIGLYVGDIRSKKDELTKEQKNKLGNKFIWEKKDTSKNKTIQEKIDIVVEYLTNKDNDPHIKSNQILEDGTPIGDYVDYIRGKYKEEKLTAPQIEQLQGKGFIWQERDSSRRKTNQDKIDVIVQYLSNSDNNPNLTTKQILEDGTPIGTYVSDIRKAYNKNKLGSKQIKQLTDVSFSWKDVKKQNAKTIDDKIDIVVEYLSNPKNNPHIKTTQVLEDGTPIGEHVKFIRKKRKEGKLDKKQIKRLGDGFIWEASEFKGLKEQKEKELSILEDLKQKAEQAENLEIESQVALENVINKNSRKPEGPGE